MSKQFDLSRMLSDMDMLHIKRNPLPEHFVAQFDQHTRELYATMLAAIILVDGGVSDNKGRLLNMLLTSLKLEGTQAKIFEQAQAIDGDKLRDFCLVCDEYDSGISFFTDALIFCRLDKPITDAQSQMLSQWAALFNLTEKGIEATVYVTAAVLGLPSNAGVDGQFDFGLVKVWDEFTALSLDENALKQGIKSGRWLLDKPLKANFDWTIDNAQIVFSPDASISTEGEFSVSIKNSKLKLPRFNFVGLENLNIVNTYIHGAYDSKQAITAFFIKNHSSDGELNFLNLKVQTVNARAIYTNCPIQLTNCVFEQCGNKSLIGGALSVNLERYTRKNWKIETCTFIKCISKLGGAIATNYLPSNSIEKSYFEECLSVFFQNPNEPKKWNNGWGEVSSTGPGYSNNVNGGAIFSTDVSDNAISDSKFVAANVYIGEELYSGIYVKNCLFIDSVLTSSMRPHYYGGTSDCSYKKGNLGLESRDMSNLGTSARNLKLDWMNDLEGVNVHSLVK